MVCHKDRFLHRFFFLCISMISKHILIILNLLCMQMTTIFLLQTNTSTKYTIKHMLNSIILPIGYLQTSYCGILTKQRYVLFTSDKRCYNCPFIPKFNDTPLEKINMASFLGVLGHYNLLRKSHILLLCKQIRHIIAVIYKLTKLSEQK